MLNLLEGEGQFCNSNDVNCLRKSNNKGNKKSFYDYSKKSKKKSKKMELLSYKSKKYTQSYDSNQLNLRFKTRKNNEERKTIMSPKKISIIHDGCNDILIYTNS